MRTEPFDYHTNHRLFGAAATVVAHLVVVICWWLFQVQIRTADEPAESIQWIDIPAARKVPVKPAAPRTALALPTQPVTGRATVATTPSRPVAGPAQEAAPVTNEPTAVATPSS